MSDGSKGRKKGREDYETLDALYDEITVCSTTSHT